MAVSRRLGYYQTANSTMIIRSTDPENPCLEPDMLEWIGCTVCEIFVFKLYCDLEAGFGVTHGHRNSTITSADPENLTLEANMTLLGTTIAKLWPFLYVQDGRQPPSWILSNRN